jgi:hypothetical protein
MRKLSTCVVVALLGGALLAACGSGKQSNTQASSVETSRTGPPAARTPQQRVEACKRIVQAPSALPAGTKARLVKTCEKVGTSTAAERELVHELCIAVASRERAGAARNRALEVCRRAP